ncbi:MAG TPA: thiamine pyrophosphate-dependent dehydrogenase E1 component subunit alpha [Terriglobales bacterium]|nr:thiamine pyrophosphate-dependent dehydrogenase E1 component subunit alpha [Terriglobales bacterium]
MKKTLSRRKSDSTAQAKPRSGTAKASGDNGSRRNGASSPNGPVRTNPHGIPDYRLEVPNFRTVAEWVDGKFHYKMEGDLSAEPPPLRQSKYLNKEQTIEIYRYMLLNRKMEQALENLFKQQKVVGGVYLGLGQEGCSCASAYALREGDWIGPMIRNQGALLVRGFKPRDVMMQYMAKSGAPTGGRDAGSHFGDKLQRHIAAPISMLGDLIPVLAGVSLGARLQGKNIACLTWIGDGGQSTGPTYEGFNFAAVQKLGVILIIENNLWAYSTPVDCQVACRDLADRAIGYGVPGVIVDGTDPNQVYDVTYEAAQRAHAGEGPTLIEAKMMRMRGHAMHDAAAYVPRPYFEYWQKRDPIARMEKYLLQRGWLTEKANKELVEAIQNEIDSDREIADASPYPEGTTAGEGVFCDNSTEIPFLYGGPKIKKVEKTQLAAASDVAHLR